MHSSTKTVPVANGAISPASSHPKAPSGTTFKSGSMMAPGCTSTTFSVKKCVQHSNATQSHRLQYWIVKASKPRKQAAIGGLTREKKVQGRKRQLIVDT